MTAVLEAVRDKPVALFPMGDEAPFQDYSGYSALGAMSAGTVRNGVSLMSGAINSSVFSNTNIGSFASPVFKQGNESKPFSLEAWAYVSAAGDIQILSNENVFDGLTANGSKVAFSTIYTATGECRAEYDLQVPRRVHLVGVYTANKNMLFVDGLLVAETEITEEQKADTFIAPGGTLYCGEGAGFVAVNGLGIYANSLSFAQVTRHYVMGNTHIPRDSVAGSYGGVRILLFQNEADIFLEQAWYTDFDWATGYLSGVVVEDSQLKPRLEAGISMPGQWFGVFPLDATDATSVYGVSMSWTGEGATVAASLDGTTWEVAQRGSNLALIPPGFNPANKELQIRVDFAGGVEDDPSYIDTLSVVGFESGDIPSIDSRTISTTGFVMNDYEPAELRDDWGTKLPSGETITVTPSLSPSAVSPKTIEVWAKGTFSTNVVATTTRSNGGTAYNPILGDWQMRSLVVPAGHTGDIVITSTSNDTIIGQIAVYEDEKTNDEISDIYGAYVGLPRATVNSSSTVGITVSDEEPALYDYEWSISASG